MVEPNSRLTTAVIEGLLLTLPLPPRLSFSLAQACRLLTSEPLPRLPLPLDALERPG